MVSEDRFPALMRSGSSATGNADGAANWWGPPKDRLAEAFHIITDQL